MKNQFVSLSQEREQYLNATLGLLSKEIMNFLLKVSLITGLICFIFIGNSFSQNSKDLSNSVQTEMIDDVELSYSAEIDSYLDPNFPQKPNAENWKFEEPGYKAALKAYAESHPPFPMYNNTGNPEADQVAFDEAKEEWFRSNPYFPQYIDTGYPSQDKERFEKARREWIHRYPEEYHTLFELVTGDDELMREYSFIIQK